VHAGQRLFSMRSLVRELQPRSVGTMKVALQGVRALVGTEWVDEATVLIDDGKIVSVDQAAVPAGATVNDWRGCLALPGIVDIHGDAVERAIAPRPSSTFSVPAALVDNDRVMLASGITTAFLSLTDSPEPGLRSRATLRSVVDALPSGALRGGALRSGAQVGLELGVDTRIHVRHEILQTTDHEEFLQWISDGTVSMVSMNDHYPEGPADNVRRQAISLRSRINLPVEEIAEHILMSWSQRSLGETQLVAMIDCCRSAGVPLASHDDESEEQIRRNASWGVAISEFPASGELAALARELGAGVLLGSPNLIRGGSHMGRLSAADAIVSGHIDALCSDYHYPSVFRAPFIASSIASCELAEAWNLVSAGPARLAGISDRKGSLRSGSDADVLIVQPGSVEPGSERLRSVWCGGVERLRIS
jgi:alpha-D-ribose 1-methylphosphonate 5-triphosphate diphosphatase